MGGAVPLISTITLGLPLGCIEIKSSGSWLPARGFAPSAAPFPSESGVQKPDFPVLLRTPPQPGSPRPQLAGEGDMHSVLPDALLGYMISWSRSLALTYLLCICMS